VKDKVKKLIAARADAFCKAYGIKDKQRVKQVLGRTAVEFLPRRRSAVHYIANPDEKLVSFLPRLEDALLYLPTDEALRTFETVEGRTLQGRCAGLLEFATRGEKHHTLEELADLAEEFLDQLERGRDYLLDTGLPRKSFRKSRLFNENLSLLYPVRLPVSVQARRSPGRQLIAEKVGSAEYDEDGNLIYDYSWTGKCPLSGLLRWQKARPLLGDRSDPAKPPRSLRFLHYKDTPTMSGLPLSTVRRLERGREKYLGLRLQLLRTLVRCVRSSTGTVDVWAEGLRTIRTTFTREEIWFYLNVDSELRNVGADEYLGKLFFWGRPGCLGGAISDLIYFWGHFMKETTVGTDHKTKSAILDLFHTFGAVKSYFQVVGKPYQPEYDKVLDDGGELYDRGVRFWKNYRKRVGEALKTELDTRIRFTVPVRSKYEQIFKDFMQPIIHAQARHLEETGRFMAIDEIVQREDDLPELSDRQKKDCKRHDYKCRDQFDVPGTRPMKRSNVIEVNGNRVRIGDSLLKLFLRLVLELKKGKGGWVNIHALEEEGLIGDPLTYQRYSNLRKALEGSLLLKNGQDFIESDGSKSYRVSTHPDFIRYDKKKLAKQHPDPDINEIAKKLP